MGEDLDEVAAPPLDAHSALGGGGEASVHPGCVLAHDAAVERLVRVSRVHAQGRRCVQEVDVVTVENCAQIILSFDPINKNCECLRISGGGGG